MLLALVALATPDPPIYGGFELVPGPYPLRISVYTEAPIPEARPIRVRPVAFRANGRPRSFRLESMPGVNLTMAKGTQRMSIDMRLVPPPSGVWVTGSASVSLGNGRAQSFGMNRYFPPTDPGDAELQRIRARYVGKEVWPYGGEVMIGVQNEQATYFTGLRPLRVVDVHRGLPPVGVQHLYTTQRPLIVTFTPVDGAEIGSRDEHRNFDVLPFRDAKATAPFLRADSGLILFESLSLTPPPAWMQAKAAKTERAMRGFNLRFARKKGDIRWILGRPEIARPWESVMSQPRWEYSIAAPFTHVLTFRRDLLVSRTMEGDLP